MADEVADAEGAQLRADLAMDAVMAEPAIPSLLARLGAETAGTFILVLIGVGTALTLRTTGSPPVVLGLAFGLATMIAFIGFGPISGAHLNPAVSVGAWAAGRLPGPDVAPYILAQVAGGALAGLVLRGGIGSLSAVDADYAKSLMSTASAGFGEHAPYAAGGLDWGLAVALSVETMATGLLALAYLNATARRSSTAIAPFSIGLSLTVLIAWALPFTNAALNPARATATALFAEPWALDQLWAWWLAPVVGAAIVGLGFRIFGPAEDLVAVGPIEAD